MRRLAIAGALLAGVAGAVADETVYAARVVRIFDGDTVWVQPDSGGRWRKLRLDGIDAPEICQPGGLASRDALSAQLLQRTVTVRQRAFDGYGRGLVVIQRDASDMNAWLVRTGWAWASRWRGQGAYVKDEQLARTGARGLWREADTAEDPRDFRRRHGPCEMPKPSAAR